MSRWVKYICMVLLFWSTTAYAGVRVYVDVVADLMHPGHVAFFKQARQFGDYLIVGVHSDADVASYKRVPIMTMEERSTLVGACRYVDEVVVNAPLRITDEWMKTHHIDVVVHGDDFDPDKLKEWYGNLIDLGMFRTVPYTQGVSTTELLQRIKERLYPSELESLNLDAPKTRGWTIVKAAVSMDTGNFTIVQPRDLSRSPNSNFRVHLGIQ